MLSDRKLFYSSSFFIHLFFEIVKWKGSLGLNSYMSYLEVKRYFHKTGGECITAYSTFCVSLNYILH